MFHLFRELVIKLMKQYNFFVTYSLNKTFHKILFTLFNQLTCLRIFAFSPRRAKVRQNVDFDVFLVFAFSHRGAKGRHGI
jgi:hypothetical protein